MKIPLGVILIFRTPPPLTLYFLCALLLPRRALSSDSLLGGTGARGWGRLARHPEFVAIPGLLNSSDELELERTDGVAISYRTALETLRVTLGDGFAVISWNKRMTTVALSYSYLEARPQKSPVLILSPENHLTEKKLMLLCTSLTIMLLLWYPFHF